MSNMSNIRVNTALLERVRKAREIELIENNDEWKYDAESIEEHYLSDLYAKYYAMDVKELAVAVTAAIDKQPLLVFQVLAEYVSEANANINKRRGQQKDEEN